MATRNRWCSCRLGLACSLMALIGGFMVHAAIDTVSTIGWVALLVGAPVGMGLCLRGCATSTEDDLTERTVAHTGVALSVLSLVVFVV